MLRIVVMALHPFLELRHRLRVQTVLPRRVSKVLYVGIEVASEELSALAKHREQHHQLPARLLPARRIGLIAKRRPHFIAAGVIEIHRMCLAVLVQVRATISFRLIFIAAVIKSRLAASKDMQPQRIIGQVFALRRQHRRHHHHRHKQGASNQL